MNKDICEVVELNCDIADVHLRFGEDYSLAFCDYGVLEDNDFLEVLISSLSGTLSVLNFVFFEFISLNKVRSVKSFEVDLSKRREVVYKELDSIRQGYRNNFGGSVSSRYAIFDDSEDVVIVAEESVPLTKIFYRRAIKGMIEDPLLDEYTFE